MLAFLGKSIVGQIAGPACAVLLVLLLMARCDNAGLRGRLEKAETQVRAAKAELAQCQMNRSTLETSIKEQNASIAALEAAGKALEARTAKELAEARRATEAAQKAGSRLLRPLTANDQCSRVIEADRRVLDDLR